MRTRRLIVAGVAAALVSSLAVAGVAMADSVSFTSGCTAWTVPVGVTSVSITAIGSAGATGAGTGGAGGAGGQMSGNLGVTYGQSLYVCANTGPGGPVGSAGSPGGSSGGAGGGASGVSLGTDFGTPVVVAGGGGGGGGGGTTGGSAGGNAGTAAGTTMGGGSPGSASTAAGPGAGGSGTAGGAFGGGGGGGGAGYHGGDGGSGQTGTGGFGGVGGSNYCATSVSSCSPLSSTAPTSSSARVTLTYTVASPPTASIATPASGATYAVNAAVNSSFSCTDGSGGSGVSSCTDQNGHASGTAIDTSMPGSHTLTVTATSSDGETSAPVSVTYNVAAAPVISLSQPANGAVYIVGQPASSSFVCGDGQGGPGLTGCLDQTGRPSGAAVDTSTLGTHTFTVTATSADGQITTAQSTYVVVGRATVTGARNRHGIITFTVNAPAAGAVDVVVSYGRTTYGRSDVVVLGSGRVPIIVVPSRSAKSLLKRHRRITTKVSVAYTAIGGSRQVLPPLTVRVTR